MEDFARRWLLDPVIGRLVALVVGLLVIVVVVRLVNRSLKRIVRDSGGSLSECDQQGCPILPRARHLPVIRPVGATCELTNKRTGD